VISRDPPSSFTKQRIARLAEQTLHDAQIVGQLPTPMEAVQDALGVREIIDISGKGLPEAVEVKKPSVIKRVLGAYLFSDKVVFIDRAEPDVRVTFTDAHEAVHAMCPWHEAALRADDASTLFRENTDMVESEANYGAGHFIFQGGRFHQRALEEQVSIVTPVNLAAEYGASRHTTLHFYVEEHPDAVALLIAGRLSQWDGTLPIWRSVESSDFLRRFGRLEERLPGGVLSLVDDSKDAPLAGIVRESRHSVSPTGREVSIPDHDGTRHTFVAEAFYNQRCHFVLVTDKKARRLGRRVRMAS